MTPAQELAAKLASDDSQQGDDASNPSGVICRLLSARRAVGLRRGVVAKHLGLFQGTLSKIESGHRFPSLRDAIKLAHFFGKPVEELWEFPEKA